MVYSGGKEIWVRSEWPSSGKGWGGYSYISYMGMCRCERYGFHTVQSGIGYRNQIVLVQNRVSFARRLMRGMNN